MHFFYSPDYLASSELYFDLSMCAVALATPLLLLYQLLRSANMFFHGSISNPMFNITIDLQFIPRDSGSSTLGNCSTKSADALEKIERDHEDVLKSFRDEQKELDMRRVRNSINSRRPKMIGNRKVAMNANNLLFAVGGQYYKNNDILKVLNVSEDDEDDEDEDEDDDEGVDSADEDDENEDEIIVNEEEEEEWEDEEVTEEKDDDSRSGAAPFISVRKYRREWTEEDAKSDITEFCDEKAAANCTAPTTSNETTPSKSVPTAHASGARVGAVGSSPIRKVVSHLALRLRLMGESSSEDDEDDIEGRRRAQSSRRDRQHHRSPSKASSNMSQTQRTSSQRKAPISPSFFPILQS